MIKNASPILAALRAASNNEAASVAFMEQQRWGDAPACPLCGSVAVYRMLSTKGGRNQDYRWRCRDCKKMYTVRTGTIFEETRLPMRVWVFAFWQACASKKGISALQLAREMEITHKSALFVLRRIRHGLSVDVMGEPTPKMTGTVEADETFVGGKVRFKPGARSVDWRKAKTPVVAMVQRGGSVRMRVMDRITSDRLGEVLAENADLSCRLITDEYRAYKPVGKVFRGGHESVSHGAGEYVREGTDIHSNTVEGVFSLLKRGVMGTFHSVSRKHLPNYLNEFEFRYNTRKVDDGQRVVRAVRQCEGKRLKYRESIDNPPYAPVFTGQTQADAPFDR